MAWTADRIDLLEKLWAEGLSAAQIANRLGGVTRSAVLGKAHRLGLSRRASPSRRPGIEPSDPGASTQERPAAGLPPSRPGRDSPEAERDGTPPPAFSPAPDAPARCRWPVGTPGEADFHFCGHPAAPGPLLHPSCAARLSTGRKPAARPQREGSAMKGPAQPARPRSAYIRAVTDRAVLPDAAAELVLLHDGHRPVVLGLTAAQLVHWIKDIAALLPLDESALFADRRAPRSPRVRR